MVGREGGNVCVCLIERRRRGHRVSEAYSWSEASGEPAVTSVRHYYGTNLEFQENCSDGLVTQPRPRPHCMLSLPVCLHMAANHLYTDYSI